MTEDRIARRFHVLGKVQGVFFRAWTIEQANAIGLDGWVRNRMDGTVEAVAVGSAAAIEDFTARLHKGSPASRVDRVDVEDTTGIIAAGFTQKPTV